MRVHPAADLATGDVWVPNYAGNNLLRIDVDTLRPPTTRCRRAAMNPYMASVDGDHYVWVSLQRGTPKPTWADYERFGR